MIMREYLAKLSLQELKAMWDESVTWDETGVLPDDAWLRIRVGVLFPDRRVSTSHVCIELVHEVWREIARRLLEDR